ncbi:MAG: hypothetical protein Tsb002_12820 [Wenzhouxiangellaceae bacterium]
MQDHQPTSENDVDRDFRTQEQRNQRRYQRWLFAWAVSYLASTYLVVNNLLAAGLQTWVVVAMPSVLALIATLAFIRYLREADELQRAIQLEALALGLFAGFIAWPIFTLFSHQQQPPPDWVELFPMVMIGFYMIGIVRGRNRYA